MIIIEYIGWCMQHRRGPYGVQRGGESGSHHIPTRCVAQNQARTPRNWPDPGPNPQKFAKSGLRYGPNHDS